MAKTPMTSLKKFLLLLHKNWLLLWHCKFGLLVELFLPAIICLLLVPIRITTIPKEMNATIYNVNRSLYKYYDQDQWDLTGLTYYSYNTLVYYGGSNSKNPCYGQIVEGAAQAIGFRYYRLSKYIEKYDENVFVAFDYGMDCDKNILNYRLGFAPLLRHQTLYEENVTYMTNQLYVDFDPIGPRNPKHDDGGQPVGYLRDGFLQVQHAIFLSFLKLKKQRNQEIPKVELRRFPYQKYIHDEFTSQLANLLPLIIMFGYMHSMMVIVWQVTTERKKPLKENMIMSGLPNWLHWTAWFVKAFVIMGLSAFLVTKILTVKWGENEYAILENSSFTEVYCFFLVYIATSITFCFMLATMFSEAITAVLVTAVIWFITFLPFMPYSILAGHYSLMTLLPKLMWLLLPNTALNLGTRLITGFEIQGDGLYWSNMFDPLNDDDSLSMGLILIAMIVCSCIYMLITLFLEQIFYVGDFRVAKKWNFPFKKDFWVKERLTNSGSNEGESPSSFELQQVDRPIGVQIINLKKSYGKQQVVKGISMNMYEDQITVLLGHNDDGKTATISMMTGMIRPSSGTVIINGYDIKKNLNGARMSLGVCPRKDILFHDLTVKEHLMFYSRLRGLKDKALDMEVKKYLKRMGLEKQADVASSKLSAGMRRLLCLCTALCGGTKVVLCDKSSSGLDAAEKKTLWKLLKSERKGRTILLTTNFVDEADVLGDRIGIMCDGELKCMGTSLFLKKKFGYGYKLTIIRRPKCRTSAELTTFLNQYIPGIKPKSDIVTESSYHLPSNYRSQFPTILQELENESNTLAINGFDIAETSLEDVLMKVGAKNSSNDAFSRMISSDGEESPTSSNIFLDNKRLFRGPRLIISQWRAMLYKKIISTWRNKFLFVLPYLFTICLVAFTINIILLPELPWLKIDLDRYHETVTVLETTSDADAPGSIEHEISSNYKAIIRSESFIHQLEDIGNQSFIDHILELGKTQQRKIDTKYIAAASIDKGRITAWLNNEPLHSAPLTLNLIHNAMAKAFIAPDALVRPVNEPSLYWGEVKLSFGRYYYSDGTHFALNFGFCMSIVTALYAFHLIKEKQSRVKQFQFMSGIDVLTYWASHFIFDYLTFVLTGLVTIITLKCIHKENIATYDELGRTFYLILLFGCSALPLTYIVARFFVSPAAGISFLAICNIINGPFIFYLLQFMMKANKYVFPEDNRKAINGYMTVIEENWLYYPHFALSHALRNFIFHNQCLKHCFKLSKNITAAYYAYECDPIKDLYFHKNPGILRDVNALHLTAVVLILFFLLTEVFSIPRLWNIIRGIFTKLPPPQADRHCDEDVQQEKLRVAHLSKRDIKLQNQNVVIKKLTKFYGSHLAVNQISVGIKHRECFGLLGGTGAGKTTLLKMLAGEEHISSGDAFVKGLSVKFCMNAIIHRKIGYCPQQFDGLFDYLTGSENLYLYALLRGVPPNKISTISMQLAASVGFREHYYKPVREYSWENKRKLSIALALLGGPSVIYLDEPTAGMNPASRQNIWNIICKLRDAGSSIVLTSQSMEECEALCNNRVALMINGEFQHIGSSQYIKSRLTKGLMLKIKMRRTIDDTSTDGKSELGIQIDNEGDNGSDEDGMAARTQKVLSFIRSKFPCAVLQDSNQEFLIFYIPFEKKWWSKLFHIDANKDSLNIEDYSISRLMYGDIL